VARVSLRRDGANDAASNALEAGLPRLGSGGASSGGAAALFIAALAIMAHHRRVTQSSSIKQSIMV